jgi:hypothetical protein
MDFTWEEIESIEEVGEGEVYDLGLLEKDVYIGEPNYIAEGIVVHNSDMHTTYCKRKKGEEAYEVHPLLKPILSNTYGVLCYQEQIMRIFNVAGGFPLTECYKIIKAISKKKGDIFEKARKKFVAESQVRLSYTEEKSIEFFEQLAKFSEYAFNKSHSVAYSYISARLLYLKAHYPLEFYTAVLKCEKKGETKKGNDESNKVMEYKLDAERNGLKLHRIDLNNSKENWEIVGDTIYMGFGNIKGIGIEVAQEIVKHQPYKSFEDFLNRFGTDANVIKPLVALRVFKESEPLTLYEFYMNFRKDLKRREDRKKRALTTREKIALQIGEWAAKNELMYSTAEKERPAWINHFLTTCTQATTAEGLCEVVLKEADKLQIDPDWGDGDLLSMKPAVSGDIAKIGKKPRVDWAEGIKLVRKYRKNVDSLKKKEDTDSPVITMEKFAGPTGDETDEEMMELLTNDIQVAEALYYGFEWEPLLGSSPDFQGMYFSKFDEHEDIVVGTVEVHVIEKPKKNVWKSGKGYSYSVLVKDGHSKIERVTLWKEDYEKWFEEELNYWESDSRKGHLIRMKLKRPEPGRKGFTLDSPLKQNRHREIPKEKRNDARMVVMARPEKKAPPVLVPKPQALEEMKTLVIS